MANEAQSTKEDSLIDSFLFLADEVWNLPITRVDVLRWLENFHGLTQSAAMERILAMHLLNQFIYFGSVEVREILKSLYRDLFRYHVLRNIREANPGIGRTEVEKEYAKSLSRTRFLGMGNPSESGSHLLYYFRQQNRLNKSLFSYQNQLFSGTIGDPNTVLNPEDLDRVVFIDDLLGSGQQAVEYSRTIVPALKAAGRARGRDVEVWYLTMFAKQNGLAVARRFAPGFDRVDTVNNMPRSQMAFANDSRIYIDQTDQFRVESEKMARVYGAMLFPGNALGYRDGQMTIGLEHNVPDNTLPIFWNDEIVRNWYPIFRRYPKEIA